MTCFSDLIGVKFQYGGRTPDAFDCWGLVRECHLRWHGVELPDYPSTSVPLSNACLMRREAERIWKRIEKPVPGSVILMRFRGFGAHVGFVHTDTRFLHATEEVGVQEARLSTFRQFILGAYDYAG